MSERNVRSAGGEQGRNKWARNGKATNAKARPSECVEAMIRPSIQGKCMKDRI